MLRRSSRNIFRTLSILRAKHDYPPVLHISLTVEECYRGMHIIDSDDELSTHFNRIVQMDNSDELATAWNELSSTLRTIIRQKHIGPWSYGIVSAQCFHIRQLLREHRSCFINDPYDLEYHEHWLVHQMIELEVFADFVQRRLTSSDVRSLELYLSVAFDKFSPPHDAPGNSIINDIISILNGTPKYPEQFDINIMTLLSKYSRGLDQRVIGKHLDCLHKYLGHRLTKDTNETNKE